MHGMLITIPYHMLETFTFPIKIFFSWTVSTYGYCIVKLNLTPTISSGLT